MPTYQVRCATCGKRKWPDLPEMPSRYVCRLCAPWRPQEPLGVPDIEKRKIRTLRGSGRPT